MRGRWTLGLFIIAIGVLILLRNIHIIDFSLGWFITRFWPLLLIIWGLGYVFEYNHAGGKFCGVIITVLGVIFLGRNLDWFIFDWRMFWKLIGPVILILIGIAILIRSFSGGNSHFVLMSGLEKKDVWRLRKGIFWALMGSIDLDLRKAEIPDGKTNLQFIAFMGGINIIVPPGMAVIGEGTSILGGIKFFGKESGGIIADLHVEQGDVKNKPQIIQIHSLTVMGGIEVKVVDN